MKKFFIICIAFFTSFFMISCGDGGESCEQNEDCGAGYVCDQGKGECVPESSPEQEGGEKPDDGSQSGENRTAVIPEVTEAENRKIIAAKAGSMSHVLPVKRVRATKDQAERQVSESVRKV